MRAQTTIGTRCGGPVGRSDRTTPSRVVSARRLDLVGCRRPDGGSSVIGPASPSKSILGRARRYCRGPTLAVRIGKRILPR